jgi:hypothetical protein
MDGSDVAFFMEEISTFGTTRTVPVAVQLLKKAVLVCIVDFRVGLIIHRRRISGYCIKRNLTK